MTACRGLGHRDGKNETRELGLKPEIRWLQKSVDEYREWLKNGVLILVKSSSKKKKKKTIVGTNRLISCECKTIRPAAHIYCILRIKTSQLKSDIVLQREVLTQSIRHRC